MICGQWVIISSNSQLLFVCLYIPLLSVVVFLMTECNNFICFFWSVCICRIQSVFWGLKGVCFSLFLRVIDSRLILFFVLYVFRQWRMWSHCFVWYCGYFSYIFDIFTVCTGFFMVFGKRYSMDGVLVCEVYKRSHCDLLSSNFDGCGIRNWALTSQRRPARLPKRVQTERRTRAEISRSIAREQIDC